MPDVVVNGIPIHYDIAGSGHPLLLVHGLFSDMHIWDVVVQRLVSTFRIIRYDLRGHGSSGKGSPEDYSINLFSDDTRSLLDELGFETVSLVGHSAGAAVCSQFAADHPERVSSLGLVGASPRSPPGLKTGVFVSRFLGVERTLRLNASRFFYPVTESKIEAMKSDYRKAGKPATIAAIRWYSAYSLQAELSKSPFRTLLVYGEKDGLLKQGREISQKIPESKLVTVPGAGHFLPVDNPEELARLISDFCSKDRTPMRLTSQIDVVPLE